VSRKWFELFERQDPKTLSDIQRAARFFYLQKNCYGGLVNRKNFTISVQDGSNYNPHRIPFVLHLAHEKAAVRRAGIRPFRFKDLRATFNSRLIEAGVIKDVPKELMGHSRNEDTNDLYSHIELPILREAIEKLELWVEKHTRKEEISANKSSQGAQPQWREDEPARNGMGGKSSRREFIGTCGRVLLVWMNEQPLGLHRPLLLKHTTQRVCAQVSRILSKLDVDTLAEAPAAELE
jgi:hypothetical protein